MMKSEETRGSWWAPVTPQQISRVKRFAESAAEMIQATYSHDDLITRSELVAAIRGTCRINDVEARQVLDVLIETGDAFPHGPATFLLKHIIY